MLAPHAQPAYYPPLKPLAVPVADMGLAPPHPEPLPPGPSAEPPNWPLTRAALSWEELWDQLISARLRFRSSVWSQDKCIVVFRRSRNSVRKFSLTERERVVFRRTLRGDRQKLIAAEAELATSTVANSLKVAMTKLGMETRLDAVPLAALALSHSGGKPSAPPIRSIYSVGQGDFIVATAPAPDWQQFKNLTSSEHEICSLIIQGKSNLEISKRRDTSVHTVENQVASLFRKVGASGRFDLLNVLYQVPTSY